MMFCLMNRLGSPVIRQCCPTLSKANIRSISISRRPKHKKLADPSVHKVVYSFKYIRLSSGFLASKLYYPITSTVLGSCVSLYYNTWALIVPIIASSAIHLTFMNIAAKFMNNLVGAVFVNREGDIDEVIFCCLDSWGRRVDRKHKLEDIVVMSGNRMVTTAGFFVVAIENSDIKYLVNFNHGILYDPKACKILFQDQPFVSSGKK